MSLAATGFASGGTAAPEIAVAAVHQALANAGAELAGSVLLFLTPHFARNTQGTVTAAARAARCLQVAGCTAPGVFTESAWSLDEPAAAALVLTGGVGLAHAGDDDAVMTLLTRPAVEHWREDGHRHFGLLSTDAEGTAPGRVWVGGKVSGEGLCEAAFSGARLAAGVSRGLRLLSPPLEISEADGHEVFELGGQAALAVLRATLPDGDDAPPAALSQLFALLPDPELMPGEAVDAGRYGLVPIVGYSEEEQCLTLAIPLAPGERIVLATRQPAAAEADTARLLDDLTTQIPQPDFAVLFACIGRGPYFFGGEDRDLAAIGERFPGLPVIGAYGGGELAPLPGGSALISYSAVMALACGDVQP